MLSAFPALAHLLGWLLFQASDALLIALIVSSGLLVLTVLELELRSPERRAIIRMWSHERLSNTCALVFLFVIPAWWLTTVFAVRPVIRQAWQDALYILAPLISLRLLLAWVHGRWRIARHPSAGIDPQDP